MNLMIKRPSRKLLYRVAQTPLCANVYDYNSTGGGSSGALSRLVPASEIGLSSSGNTIGVLNTDLVPSTIVNPTRLLFGLPSNLVLQKNSSTPVPLSVVFSTSSNVDIVTSVRPGEKKQAGSAGFYFRNQFESDYYYMVGSFLTSGGTEFSQRAVIVAVPAGVSPSSAQISDVPGFVATFTMEPGVVRWTGDSFVLNPNIYFRVSFNIATPVAVGALQPLTENTSAVLGYFDTTVNGGENVSQFRPKVEQVTYVCFS